MKTLIVEDEPTGAKILKKTLHAYGEVKIAPTSEEGFNQFINALSSKEPFDLICLDISLPGLDGIELLDEIRRVEEDNGVVGSDGVKVVIISGICTTDSYVDAKEAGCTSYLCKPIEVPKLLAELSRLELLPKKN